MIYICIPVFNRVAYTRKCILSIKEQSFTNYTIIICDDGSTDGTTDLIHSEFSDVIILPGNGNLWWSGGTNKCVEWALERSSPGDFIFTLNNDTELASDTFLVLTEFSKNHAGSIISCGNYFNNDRNKLEATAFVEKGKRPFPLYHRLLFPWGQDVDGLEMRIYEVNSVSGKGVLIPVEAFQKVGLYNADKLPQYHGDTEFTRRASEAGFKIFLNLNAVIYTDQSASGIGQVNSAVSLKEFVKSFRSLRSENNLLSLYNRAILVYHRKWFIYLVANVFSIIVRFIKRYVKYLIKSLKKRLSTS
jgi:GT2 family glycosyltransferase